ncbi:tyrosine-type recombinase/integrase [Xanthobacter sp. VTT E-85241]|uniref:tyrosine-type recombinase/integrase n=1 Tax=Roseixanthobacter finlandensis TaxID=3119922 RepID=UPI003727B82B
MSRWLLSLPYLQRSRHGVFRYRRAVPLTLRGAAGKREILTSLRTKNPADAELRLLQAHLDAETWLRALRPDAPIEPLPWPFRSLDTPVRTALQPQGASSAQLVPPMAPQAPNANQLNPVTLSGALALYLTHKEDEFATFKGRQRQVRLNEKHRVIRYLTQALGSDKAVVSLTREDARSFRDFLRGNGLAPGSINKNIKIAAAIIQTTLIEYQLTLRNPFHNFHVANEIADRDARLPLSTEEIDTVLRLKVNDELLAIVKLLAFTGARLNEIAGLTWEDIRLSSAGQEIAHIEIRANAVRSLKTANSRRTVPLISVAEYTILQYRKMISDTPSPSAPVFPRYGRPGGSDAASAALMKALRKAGITDARKSIHSLRHALKQMLREAGCPKDIRDAIQGHASGDIAENYGLGHSLKQMIFWIESVFKNTKFLN